MASATDKVMQYVERELAKNPDVSNDTLLEGAKKIDKSVTALTPRQFHAKYPLQVKRRSGKPSAKKKKKKSSAKASRRGGATRGRRATKRTSAATTTSSAGEDQVRSVMMKFAKALSSADSQVETIEVLSNLDRYVSDIMKAART